METININDYKPYMGVLFVLDDTNVLNAKRIKASTILDNPSKYLDKNNKYYFTCKNGTTSRRVVQILKVYGYNVTRVIL